MIGSRLLPFFLMPLLTLAGGCSVGSTFDSALSAVGGASPPATRGLTVADEPLAAKAGTAVLAQGGSAADAVTAMFFTLTATYPVAAGLGGGGLCILRGADGQMTEFDFLPRASAGGGAYAVPGTVRGFHDLQTAFGKLPWQRDVAPGEAYAATGFPISRALADRINPAQNVVRLDAQLAAEFLDESGKPKPEGSVTANIALSQTLSAVRLNGADGFYQGPVAAGIASYADTEGGAIGLTALAAYRATRATPRMVTEGGLRVALPRTETGAGAFAGALLTRLAGGAGDQAALLRQTLSGFGVTSLPPDLGATGFAALDAAGGAAACAVTLNGPFGSGHTAGDTGVTLAAAPTAAAGLAGAFLTPLLADQDGKFALAGTGAGGPGGSAAILSAMLGKAQGKSLLRPADLPSTGAAPYDAVNIVSCRDGLCVALADAMGHGLGAAVDDPGDVAMKVEGVCHCGAVAYEAVIDPAQASICHCSDCQVLSGAAYRVSVPARAESFHILRGAPRIYVKTAESGNRRAQGFCADCGTPIYAADVAQPKFYMLRVGPLKQRPDIVPRRQIWCRSALAWASDIGGLTAHDKMPG